MKRLLTSVVLLIPLLIVFAACADAEGSGAAVTVTVDGLDSTCAADEDCVPVYVGDMCKNPGCHCPGGAAVNATSLPVYEAEYATKRAQCDGASHGVACSCVIGHAACEHAICVTR